MKPSKRILSLLLSLAMCIPILSACGTGGQGDETTSSVTSDPTPPTLSLIEDGKLTMALIRPMDSDSVEVTAFNALVNALDEVMGKRPEIGDDWENRDDNAEIPEILVGNTNRAETKEALSGLKRNEFAIRIIGKKLVIVGYNAHMTKLAVEAFIKAYLKGASTPGVIPTGLHYTGQGKSQYIDKNDESVVYVADALNIVTNSAAHDKAYIVKNTAAAIDRLRFCDGRAELIYRLEIGEMLEPKIVLGMLQEYRVEVGESKTGPWREIETYATGATLREVGIDPLALGYQGEIFIRLTDPTPENGGGAAITFIKVNYYTESDPKTHPYYMQADVKKAAEELSGMLEKVEISDPFLIHADGGMIYDPVSREKAGQLYKYNGADAFTGTLTLGDKTLTYSIPKQVTAYDAVPLTYTLNAGSAIGKASPLHLSVTGHEDKERTGEEPLYDLNLPGKVDLFFDYDGYVAGKKDAVKKPVLSTDFGSDYTAQAYPDYSVSDLRRSGTVEASDYTWFKFTYTNIGNTVLDGDGNGTFCFEPILYKKEGSGYKEVTGVANIYNRIIDEVYPGESGTLWVIFPTNLTPGDYKVVIDCIVRNEIDHPENFGRTIWGGEVASSSAMEFTVSAGNKITEPKPVMKTTKALLRNAWLHYYEEFQSSYTSFLKADAGVTEGTVYVQLAPWTNQVMVKLIDGNTQNMTAVSIPIDVESDSLKIQVDPENPSYVLLEDGTRFPAIMVQSMADMRINLTQSPYAAEDITKYLCEMKDLGINVINTTAGFCYGDGNGQTAFQFSMDVAKKLGLKVEGFVSYPYAGGSIPGIASEIAGKPLVVPGPGYDLQDIANSHLASYQFKRWGSNYWVIGQTPILSVEDTRGGFGITTSADSLRPVPTDSDMGNFRIYLRSLYGSISELNKAWDTKFDNFYEVELKTTVGFSRALSDYDTFLAYKRAINYRTMLDAASPTVPGAKVDIRLEGSHWICKIDENDTRQAYRFALINQRTNGLTPELLTATDAVYTFSDYVWEAYSPSEVAYMSKSSYEDYGVVSAQLPLINRLRDMAVNEKYGGDYSAHFHINGKATKAVQVNTTVSLYEWWKATYENHGVPGLLWSDWLVDGYATMTQRREIEFFVSKLKEAMKTPEGIKWSTEFEHDESVLDGAVSTPAYKDSFVQGMIDDYYKKKED